MSLQFKALGIGSGDAFLIEDENKTILFDSGGSKTKLVKLLKKKIKKIDLAICSHNDIDHTNGFIGLLESSDIDIEEIWLPGLWASILQFVKSLRLEDYEKIIEPIYTQEILAPENQSYSSLFQESSISIGNFDNELCYLSEYTKICETFLQHRLCYHRHYHPFDFKQLIELGRIIKIANLAYQKCSKIRWFEPTQSCQYNFVDYGFKALNSIEILQVKKLKDVGSLIQALCLTNENKYSLVFEFYHNDIPVIRFSADSDCNCQSMPSYNNNIIITAPHHGSEANKIVYDVKQGIHGTDIIWVRSDRKSRKRPCDEFKKLKNKYCLACFAKKLKPEIYFKYNDSTKSWDYKAGDRCVC